jgi:trans-2-enoyl-CoA reductase
MKTTRYLAFALLLSVLLTACGGGGLSGTYEAVSGEREITFRGSTATFRPIGSTDTYRTAFNIEDGFISFTITQAEMQKLFEMVVTGYGDDWQDDWEDDFDLDALTEEFNTIWQNLLFTDDGDRIFIGDEMFIKK